MSEARAIKALREWLLDRECQYIDHDGGGICYVCGFCEWCEFKMALGEVIKLESGHLMAIEKFNALAAPGVRVIPSSDPADILKS